MQYPINKQAKKNNKHDEIKLLLRRKQKGTDLFEPLLSPVSRSCN